MRLFVVVLTVAELVIGQRGPLSSRGFSSLFGNVQRVGDQLLESVKEAGKIASVLAGDAHDALKTVKNFN